LGLEALDEGEEGFGDGAGFGDGVGDGDVGDFGAFEDDEATEFSRVDEVDGGDAVTGGEHAVVGRGRAAALGVAEIDAAGFVASALFDLFGEGLADAAEAGVAEGV